MSPSRAGPIALAALLVGATVAALANPSWFVPDDGYFYLVFAENLRRGLGSTFDGVTFSNGYHPLWMITLAPFVSGDPDQTLATLVLLCAALTGLALELWYRLGLALRVDTAPAAAMLLVYLLGTPNLGSELHLAVLTQLFACLLLFRAHDRPSVGRAALVGVGFGLAVLSRLDLCFFAGFAVLSLGPRRALAAGGGLVATLAPYLLWNLVNSGHVVPISGATKSTFPVPHVDHLVTKLGGSGVAVIGLCVVMLPLAARFASGPLRRVWVPMLAGAAAHGVYTGAFTAFGWSQDYFYYYSTAVLAVAVAASVVATAYVERLPSLSPTNRSRLLAAMSATFAAICLVPAWTMNLPESAMVQAGRWIGKNTTVDAVIFTVDAPGRLAFWGRRPVLALDGLTQDWGFDPTLRASGLEGWLVQRGVTHVWTIAGPYEAPWVVTDHADGQSCLDALAPRSRHPVGRMCFRDDQALTSLSRFAGAPGSEGALGGAGLWRWPACVDCP